jgi:hypothetical protein
MDNDAFRELCVKGARETDPENRERLKARLRLMWEEPDENSIVPVKVLRAS